MSERSAPPPPDQQAGELAAALGGGVVAAGTAGAVGATGAALAGYWAANAAVLAALMRLWVRWGLRRETIRHLTRVVVEIAPARTAPGPGAGPRVPGPAARANARASRVFSAWFLQRSADRVDARIRAGQSVEDAVGPERRYVDQHIAAQARRAAAAARVDAEASKPGHVLVQEGPDEDGMGRRARVVLLWRAHPDDKVTPECRAADGAWFYADTPPVIGYPGMPHGGTCRCWPVRATAEQVARGRTVDQAVRDIIRGEVEHRPHPGSSEPDERQTA